MSFPAVAALAAHLLVLFLPGGVVALAAGLRIAPTVAVAPLVSYGLATVAGTVAGVLGIAWHPWSLAAETAVAAALVLLSRRRKARAPRRPWPVPRRSDFVVAAGVLVGGCVTAGTLLHGFGGIDRPNQDWDYTFHANATRFIADSGQVAPSALRAINAWDAKSFFYPNAYHALTAVVADLTGAPVFEVLNTHTLLIGAMAGLGLAVLLRELALPPLVCATTPVLLAGCVAFPYDLVWRGPVLPYATGLALVPAAVLLLRGVLARRSAADVGVASLGGAGLLGLQPSAAVSVAVLVLALVVQRAVHRRRLELRGLGALAATGVLIVVLAAPEVAGSLRTGISGPDQDWPAVTDPAKAMWDLLLLGQASPHRQVAVAVLVVVGLISLPRARALAWWAAGTATGSTLFVLAAASDSALAQALTRPWWNDAWRLAAWAALGMAPLAALGLHRMVGTVRALLARAPQNAAGLAPAVPVLALVAVVVATAGLATGHDSRAVATAYQSQRYLSGTEIRAMAWLAERVQPGETVMNDPADGSAYMWAVEGIRPLFGHQVPPGAYSEMGPRQRLLYDRFQCLDTDAPVRALVEQLRVRYVFLAKGYVRPHMRRMKALRAVADSPSLTLVHSDGAVRIYRVQLQPVTAQPLPGCRPAAAAEPTD